MTTATQTQFRRDTAAHINAQTPANGEPAWDLTNFRLRMGDGSTAGGLLLPMAKDIQSGVFTYIAQGGTANAWTATMAPATPSVGAGSEVTIKCSTPNTSAFTLNVDGHGAVSVKKRSGGALIDPVSGDTFANALYKFQHDGTYWELMDELDAGGGLVSVSQGNLNTATGSVTSTSAAAMQSFTLPGGLYGFFPQTKSGTAGTTYTIAMWDSSISLPTSYATRLAMNGSGTTGHTTSAQQLYITSSPPFDLGDGELAGFIFAVVNKAGEIISTYIADVPPWAYNGPTNIRADYIDRRGRKFRKSRKPRSLDEIMDGAEHEIVWEEITQAHKNADMRLIPHPFGGCGEGETIVLLNPRDDRLARIMQHHAHGGSEEVIEALHNGNIYAGNEFLPADSLPCFPSRPFCPQPPFATKGNRP
jgi:hypothetical protein